MLVILEIHLKCISVDTTCCIDFIDCKLSGILNSLTVYSSASGNRSDAADFKGSRIPQGYERS